MITRTFETHFELVTSEGQVYGSESLSLDPGCGSKLKAVRFFLEASARKKAELWNRLYGLDLTPVEVTTTVTRRPLS